MVVTKNHHPNNKCMYYSLAEYLPGAFIAEERMMKEQK